MTRKKITAANFYDILQSYHGGSFCVRGLNKALSDLFDVALFTFHDDMDIYFDRVFINDHFYVSPLAKPKSLKERENKFHREVGFEKLSIYDTALSASRYYCEVPEFITAVKDSAKDSDIVIAEHPYTYRLLRRAVPDKRIWYRAHNVEYDYKDKAWKHCENHDILLKEAYDIEKECCDGCDLILTITKADADRFHSLYNIPEAKMVNISAGTDISAFVMPSERKELTAGYESSAVFLSSYAEVAAEAAKRVFELARKTPMIMYYIVGSVCAAIEPKSVPPNLCLAGIVSEEEKEKYLTQADFALNLIENGSGMNVKMLEYFAFGLPVVTTEFGVRGISAVDKTHCIITNEDRYVDDVLAICKMSKAERDVMAKNAYELVKKDYSWGACVGRILNHLSENDKSLYDSILNTAECDTDKAANAYPQQESLDKLQKYYVFGAGKFGEKNIGVLATLGITPEGIIDNNPKLWGSRLQQNTIYPPEIYYQESDAYIIVAANIHYAVDILKQLVDSGVARERIYVDLDGAGIYPCGVRSGSQNYFYDVEKILTMKERGCI